MIYIRDIRGNVTRTDSNTLETAKAYANAKGYTLYTEELKTVRGNDTLVIVSKILLRPTQQKKLFRDIVVNHWKPEGE